jgi:hypothetical protein
MKALKQLLEPPGADAASGVQIGIALLAGLLSEINALVPLVMLLCVIAHWLGALLDAQYTVPSRYISPFEQHVHPLKTPYLIMLVPVLLVQGALLAEEAFRCRRARARPKSTTTR